MKIKKTDLPDGWKSVKLKDVCLKTSNIKWNDNNGEEFNYIDLSAVCRDSLQVTETVNVNKNNAPSRAKKIIYTGDVIFATTRPTLKRVAIIPNELNNQICSTGFTVLRPNSDKILTEYLFYSLLLDSFMIRMEALQRGASYPAVTDTDVKGFQIPLPPLPEQHRIVSILDHCFKAIDKAKANAEQNLKNAKELFESCLQGVFQKKGEGWEEKRFDEICVLQRGFDLPKRSRFEGDNPLVTSNGITDRIDKWKVEAPGVVTGRSGTIGNVHFIEENFWPLNTSLYIKEFHGNYERFIYYFLIHFDLKKYSSGAGVPTLNRNNVHSEMASVPKSIDVQKRIVNQLDLIYIETQQLESFYQKKIDDLEELKKSILQKAFAGELKTDKMVEEFA